MPFGISATACEAVYSRQVPPRDPRNAALEQAIDRLYTAFSKVPRPRSVDRCGHWPAEGQDAIRGCFRARWSRALAADAGPAEVSLQALADVDDLSAVYDR